MTTQPEALRIADGLEEYPVTYSPYAAAELRRLHEAHDWQYKMAGDRLRRIEKLERMNQELLDALKEAADALETASNDGGVNFYQYAKEARAAINKATGEQA